MPFLNQWNNAASAISHFSPVWIPMWWLSGFEGLVETLFWAVKVWQIKPRCGPLIGDGPGPVLNSLSLVSPRQSAGIWVIGNKQGLCACCFLFVFPSRGRLQVPWGGAIGRRALSWRSDVRPRHTALPTCSRGSCPSTEGIVTARGPPMGLLRLNEWLFLYRRHRRSTVAVLDWLCVFLTNYQPRDAILGETGGTYFPSEFKDYMSSFGKEHVYMCQR